MNDTNCIWDGDKHRYLTPSEIELIAIHAEMKKQTELLKKLVIIHFPPAIQAQPIKTKDKGKK